MHLLPFLVLIAVAAVQGEEGSEKETSASLQHFASGDKYFLAGKRNGGYLSAGQIYPRLGRGFHESPRPLLPFSRILRRPYWRYPLDSLLLEYEDSFPGASSPDAMSPLSVSNLINSVGDSASLNGVEENEMDKRNGANGGNMWFGPRLGKRRKRSVEADSGERARETFDTRLLMKLLHNLSWAIVPVKQRRNFTPRLGRSGSEETAATHHSSLPFSPRLGRSREVPSSVEFDLEDDESQSRYIRSDGGSSVHGRSTQQPAGDEPGMTTPSFAPFSPRLGRDHFSPRLGRSGSGDDRE